MAKPKTKKTVTRKASLASLPDIRTAHDAADNPLVPLLISNVMGQRNGHEHTATLENIGQGDNSENIRAGFTQSKDEAVHEQPA